MRDVTRYLGMTAKPNKERQADYRRRLAEEQKLREVRGVHVPAEAHDEFKADMQVKAQRLVRAAAMKTRKEPK